MDSEIRSIQRWLMLISLLLTIRIYYLASHGYNDAAADLDDNVVILFSFGLGILILLHIGSSFLSENQNNHTQEK